MYLKTFKRTLLFSLFLANTNIFASEVSPKEDLVKHLNSMPVCSARVKQTIIDNNKKVLQASGEILMDAPASKFSWSVFEQGNENVLESKLISNGKFLWLYQHALQQVTIKTVKDVVSGTPFNMIMHHKNKEEWKSYNVRVEQDSFVVESNNTVNSPIKKFSFTLDQQNCLKTLTTYDDQNLITKYEFYDSKIKQSHSTSKAFEFKVPKEADIDDQTK